MTATDGTRPTGIFPAHMIRELFASGAAASAGPLDADQIQPASLDLRLGDVAYRVRASFLTGPQTTVEEKLQDLRLHTIPLTGGAVLETGCVYIVPLMERLALPADIAAAANPKSSTGRLDVFTRVIADRGRAFDTVPAGYCGPLYAEISPRTFPVLVRAGSRLSQIRFRRGSARITEDDLAALHRAMPLIDGASHDFSGGVPVSIDLEGRARDGLVGFRAKRHTAVIDVDAKNACDVLDFWEPMTTRGSRSLVLDPNEFYILVSREAVCVPPETAAEMVPFDPLVGEFRVHYAGFFDPGFGYDGAGGAGARAVLEVRSHEVPFIVDHGQTVGRLVYEHLAEKPEALYGEGGTSSYQGQALKLSKHFRALD
ncbi:dCTP deaminase [Rhodobium orientis]|uniref:2'-deoxycytidine 5'-triphosphate deaminase n=1 Tax=Rhodobium orientis TaxID=34017 RepID=A0A327JGV3_9HYPH|nr:2'-deoxycytidine 5'-triphosphate deaminase [Rhodobium orientis]MBB4305269.1 dCTP deaminase [Rhodobium orientis]MBK5949606.1 2'-deoxycytidine 5'-triphosphate deaminase [Rhodobium orientis]RAI25161.1 2'-deoxycytidine 5'-triphosphate deaminase [Rhodobium orientis]